jgi:hypothetical protein
MKEHVTRQVQSANYTLCRISKIRHLIDFRTAKQAVVSLALSKLTYGCQSVSSAGELHRLQKVQNYAARIVTGTPRTDHISPALKNLGWLKIKDCLNVKSLMQLHRTIYPSADPSKYFQFSGVSLRDTSVHGTRQKATVTYDPDWGDGEVRKRAARLWNCLPLEIRGKNERQPFKNALKSHYSV